MSIVIGYGAGLAAVLHTLRWCDDARCRNSTIPFLGYAPRIYTSRYEYLTSVVGSDAIVAVVILGLFIGTILFAVIALTSILTYFSSAILAPINISHALPETRRSVRVLWREQMRNRSSKHRWLAIAGVVLGFSGAWAGLAEAAIKYHLRCVEAEKLQLQWAYNSFRTPQPPGAALPSSIVATFNITDGIWIFGGAGLLSAGWLIYSARRSLLQSEALADRWCLDCGHDIRGLQSQVCPECGAAVRNAINSSLPANAG